MRHGRALEVGDVVRHPGNDKVGVLIEKTKNHPEYWKVLTGEEVDVWFEPNFEKVYQKIESGINRDS